MNEEFQWFLLTFFIYCVVGWLWQSLELFIYGQTQPRIVDDIIGIILTVSIVINVILFTRVMK